MAPPTEKLDFAAQMALAMSKPSQKKSKSDIKEAKKDDIFKGKRAKGDAAKRAAKDMIESPAFAPGKKDRSNKPPALDDENWMRSQANMEKKAKLYNAIKRGDAEDATGRYQVDFDRKWVEKQEANPDRASDDEFSADEKGSDDDAPVEYVDEFGRTRYDSKKEAQRLERVKMAGERQEMLRGELRPQAPSGLIYGDVIQSQAFKGNDAMDLLAMKRDKSATPPPEKHFDHSEEARVRGTGFFGFSGDAEERRRQMEELEQARKETEKVRGEQEDAGSKMARERMEEERKRELAKKGAKRKADAFLGELEDEIAGKRRFVKGGEIGLDGVERDEAGDAKY